MQPAQHRTHRPAAIVLLAAALLLAQWLGLAHRIVHAPGLPGHAQAWFLDSEDGTASRHSCLMFDAAAAADAIQIPPFGAPQLPCQRPQAAWHAFSSRDAPVVLHFSSRAPPPA